MSADFDKPYDPKRVEPEIYEKWEKSGFFNPDNLPNKKGKAFTIIMPPPNANGALHIGHAVFVTLQDIMIRYQRMRGRKTLWLPGADHAGFETQVVFDKKLEKEGRSRFKIPREELYKEMLEFTLENKKIMEKQLRKLGASCDWSRGKFTLEADIIDIVYDTFKKLFEDGFLYRENKIVNWCTKHQTTLSDLEVKYVEKKDPLYYIKYGPVTLATVRLETKFGDTAVAVNPKDRRYKNLVGKEIEIKTLLGPAKIKVIADEAVDPKFGTGAVKVTPAHDPNDFEIWKRHKDEIPGPRAVIDKFGRMDLREFWSKPNAQKYHGLKVMEARKVMEEDMKKEGLMVKIDNDYIHAVATCYKCGTTLEPRILPQWFVKMTEAGKTKKSLRDLAVGAVQKGEVKFIPARMEKIFRHWMKNLRDWNVSRQIVWGIPIPAWYCLTVTTSDKKMGFYQSVVPQVFDGKTKTYRIRDHNFRVGDRFALENSQMGKIFGYGEIIAVEEKRVKEINLQDKKHHATYENIEELIAAIQRHNLDYKVDENSKVFIYTYTFSPLESADKGCGEIIISKSVPEKCPRCGSKNLIQDSDVFDTWFSSGQWPFATLMTTGRSKSKIPARNASHSDAGGKNQKSKSDFEEFYPTDVMETGHDILFFWVARMIMLGIYRTEKVPFKTVYLHGLVRDKDRQKMSKSKGNVIDPLGVAELYGTDAVRMALVVGNTAGNDIIISEEKIRGYRNFANKIWNATRFVLTQIKKSKISPARGGQENQKSKYNAKDKTALVKLKKLVKETTRDLENYHFHHAAERLYHFFWHYYADKIIEEAKKGLISKALLLEFHATLLKLLHPFLPFITERIWQELNKEKLLMIESWPKV